MANPFYLIWQEGTTVLEGYANGDWIDGQLTFPIVFPGVTTAAQALSLSSSASVNLTFETLINVAFYLTGSDAPRCKASGLTSPMLMATRRPR